MKVLADATLPNIEAMFNEPFILTGYDTYDELLNLLPEQDILICRSTLKVSGKLLTDSPIQCVATASSGIDHIDKAYLEKHQIALFDAKGCNASAVADYVVSTLAYLDSQSKIGGDKAGIIGVGEVGSRVVSRLHAAGFHVICFDPFKEKNENYIFSSLEDLTHCNVICVHANLHTTPPHPSANLLTTDFLTKLNPGTIIINAARGGIIDEKALLNLTTPLIYCTDVYYNEPNPSPEIIHFSTLCTPHIAGHSIEAKEAAVFNVCEQIYNYYGLSMPIRKRCAKRQTLSFISNKNWQNIALSLYNPLRDTIALKSASDKKHTFLTLRKAHQYRHNFNFYDIQSLPPRMKILFDQ